MVINVCDFYFQLCMCVKAQPTMIYSIWIDMNMKIFHPVLFFVNTNAIDGVGYLKIVFGNHFIKYASTAHDI